MNHSNWLLRYLCCLAALPSALMCFMIGHHQLFWTTYAITYRTQIDSMKVFVCYDFAYEYTFKVYVLEFRDGEFLHKVATQGRPETSTKWKLLEVDSYKAIGGMSDGKPIVLCVYQNGVGRVFPGQNDQRVMQIIKVFEKRLASQPWRQ